MGCRGSVAQAPPGEDSGPVLPRLSQFVYEDAMDLIAKLPCVAAKIYRNLYREGSSIGAIDPNLDWSHNFTNMLGYTDPQFIELMRLYLTIHRCGAGRSSRSRRGLGPAPSPGARDGARSWDMPGLLWGVSPATWCGATGSPGAGLCCSGYITGGGVFAVGSVPAAVGVLGRDGGDLTPPLAPAVTMRGET